MADRLSKETVEALRARCLTGVGVSPNDSCRVAPKHVLPLIDELLLSWEERDAALFAPLGDNHHNAAACPHCGDLIGKVTAERDDWHATSKQWQIIHARDCTTLNDLVEAERVRADAAEAALAAADVSLRNEYETRRLAERRAVSAETERDALRLKSEQKIPTAGVDMRVAVDDAVTLQARAVRAETALAELRARLTDGGWSCYADEEHAAELASAGGVTEPLEARDV